jgi:hypothetical protein
MFNDFDQYLALKIKGFYENQNFFNVEKGSIVDFRTQFPCLCCVEIKITSRRIFPETGDLFYMYVQR